jgi:LPXTG-motif cell wall-anchored protein
MKRAIGVIASAFVAVLVMAGTALAGNSPYPVTPDPTTIVKSSGGGTAFTGGNISTAVIVVGVLALLGVAALFVARRRTATEA